MADQTKFCGIEVAIQMGKPVGSPKGVIMGIPHEIEDEEILEALKTQGITAAKRICKNPSSLDSIHRRVQLLLPSK